MKSLVPWMYVVLASASQTIFASDDFHAYRLGQYKKAAAPLLAKTGSSAIADYYLGRMYLYGYGELKNNVVAMRYFQNAATKGYLPAIIVMAKYSLFKENNPELAVNWFKKAAALNDVSAQMFMAAAYLYGIGVKPHEDVAIKYYIEAAKNGNPIAQYTLASHFIDSKHSSNAKLGLIWLNKAAANGNPKAQARLGSLSFLGKMVPKNIPLAIELLTKAALQNEPSAMLWLGDLAFNQGQYQIALNWYQKAVNLKDKNAYLHLAHAYLVEKSPIYDPHTGYLWTLQAAQSDVIGAKSDLAKLYQKGLGVAANEEMAKQWALLETQPKKQIKTSPLEQAALWLSNGKTKELAQTSYQMEGILSVWQNPAALKDNIYNQAPQMELFKRADIFKPQFALTQPNSVPISTYYYALIKQAGNELISWDFPAYPLNKAVEALNNKTYTSAEFVPAPYKEANYYQPSVSNSLVEKWTSDDQKQKRYKEIFDRLYFRAILGDAQSQFEIGQMFQYGLGVPKNDQSAIIFYENAAASQHLGAEYNLGILYLQSPQNAKSYEVAFNWLNDAAFKGNSRAQYVLSRILLQGKKDEKGKYVIKPNPDQAMSMLYIAAAQGYGLAMFELATNLAQQTDNTLNLEVKKQKASMIRQLFEGASKRGIAQAYIPLAFYNAVENEKEKQKEAFTVAKAQAELGNKKAALLLGLLYDRGIGVEADHNKAMTWYKLAGDNSVSQFILGTYIAEGKGIRKDRDQGILQLKQAADNSFSYAYFNLAALEQQAGKDFLPDLAMAYRLGNSHAGIVLADYYLSTNNDLEKIVQAQQIYQGLANKGDGSAQLKLGYMLDKGLAGKRDLVSAEKWYVASAQQGNPVAQFLLGQWFQVGENAEPNYNLAREWYQKAAPQLAQASIALGFIDETVFDNYPGALKFYEKAALKGEGKGIYNLALMYLYGKGMPVDFKKAKMLFNEASSKGIHEAINQLAELSYYGLGEVKNEQAALSLYKKAARLDNPHALYQLGVFAETGHVLKQNHENALQYYQKSAAMGDNKAMLALARIHHSVKKDAQTSADIYQTLAIKQNAYAQYRLGTFYMEGTAGKQSPDRARQLLKQAVENGNQQARHVLRRLEAQTKTEISFIEPLKMKAELKTPKTQVKDVAP